MKIFLSLWFIIGAIVTSLAAPFQNLDFDEANTNNVVATPGAPFDLFGPTSEMLPHWTLLAPTESAGEVGLNTFLAGPGYVTLVQQELRGHLPVEGKYSLYVMPGSRFDLNLAQSVAQIGEIPPEANSIEFLSYEERFEVRVNDVPIALQYERLVNPDEPLMPVARVFGDIRSFAGQTVELKFTAPQTRRSGYGLDSISFSPKIVPEPSTWVLFGLGGLTLLAVRWRGRRLFTQRPTAP